MPITEEFSVFIKRWEQHQPDKIKKHERYNEVMNEIRAMYCVPKSKQKMKKKGKYSPIDILDHRVNRLGQDVEVVYEFIKKKFMITPN